MITMLRGLLYSLARSLLDPLVLGGRSAAGPTGLAPRTYPGGHVTPHEAAITLEWVTSEFMLRWLERVPGVTIEWFGSAWGSCAPDRPELDFHNTVHRLLPEDVEQVPRIAERYAAAGVRPWLELMPAPGFERLAAALREAGAHQVDFLGVFERELPATRSPQASGIEILQPPPDTEEFSTVMLTGHGLSEDQLTKAVPRHVPMAAVEGASLYLATVGGRPAAAAALFVEHGIGHLANASTMPGYRGRGCQTALIERRLRDAAAAGCSRASVVAAWGSQSHRNLVRAGFRTAYTKAVWRVGE